MQPTVSAPPQKLAIKRLKKRLKMLHDYRSDSLTHRAGDVELAVETVVFEQLLQQSNQSPDADLNENNNSSLRQTLDEIQGAIADLTATCRSRSDSGASEAEGNSCHTEAAINNFAVDHHGYVELIEHELIVSQLNNLRQEYEDLVTFLERDQASKLDDAATTNCDQPSQSGDIVEYELLQRRVEELTEELVHARDDANLNSIIRHENDAAHTDAQIESLREKLLEERQSVVELRLEIDDLKAAMVSQTSPGAINPIEFLTWDQQKVKLLAQLEHDTIQSQIDEEQSLEIHAILAQTQNEIERRDQEIAELRRLLSEQSTATQTIAIGAAAVAELLDHDDLISEERENLRRMQEHWQNKQREAEIDISIERAKLARQRSELDERLKDLERETNKSLSDREPTSNGGSRWLSRLGLGEGKTS